MQDKDLQKLRRADLLEMLVELSRENDTLRKQLAAANAEIANREIMIQNAGSLAEASMRINGVFEAVQKAADQYLDNIRHLATGVRVQPAPMELPKESSAARLGASVLNAAAHGALDTSKRSLAQRTQQASAKTEPTRTSTARATTGKQVQPSQPVTQRTATKTPGQQPARVRQPAVLPKGSGNITAAQQAMPAGTSHSSEQRKTFQAQKGPQQNIALPNAAGTRRAGAKPASAVSQNVDGGSKDAKH